MKFILYSHSNTSLSRIEEDIRNLNPIRSSSASALRSLPMNKDDIVIIDYKEMVPKTVSGILSAIHSVIALYDRSIKEIPALLSYQHTVYLPYDYSEEELAADIRLKQSLGYERSEVLALTLNNQIGRAIVRRAGSGDAAVIAHTAKNFTLEVNGTLGFDYAQVTRGGVDMPDVNDDLESALCPGLFFAGEVLDVDGDCGGYNLTWAFASAARVAEAIAGRQI